MHGASLLGIFAKTFPGSDPLTVLRQVRAAGYDAAQYNMACSGLDSLPLSVSHDSTEALRAAIEATGVSVVALSATYNMSHPDSVTRQRGAEALATLVRVADSVGIPLLTVCTGSRNEQDPWAFHPDNITAAAWEDMRSSMQAALDAIRGTAITLAIEPEPGTVVGSVAAARYLLDELASPKVGVVLDLANLLEPEHLQDRELQEVLVTIALDVLGDRIVLVHAKDRDAQGRVVPAGHGLVALPFLCAQLKARGIHVPIVTHGLEAIDAAAAARWLRSVMASAAARMTP